MLPADAATRLYEVDVVGGARPAMPEHAVVGELRAWREPGAGVEAQRTSWRPARGRVAIPRVGAAWLPAVGDTIRVLGRVEPPGHGLHEFTFRPDSYARAIGVTGTLWVEGEPVLVASRPGLLRAIDRFRLRVERSILSRVSGPEAGVLLSMVTSSRQELDPEVNRQFAASGITHVLAVSGMHLTLLALCLVFVLDRLLRWVPLVAGSWGARRTAVLLTAPVMVAYVVLTGAPASAVRSGVMALLVVAATALDRRPSGRHALWGSVVLMVAWEPLWLLDVGFQLSVAATWALLAHGRQQRQAGDSHAEAPVGRAAAAVAWCRKNVRETLLTSVAACLATAPVVIWNFGALPLLSPLANLLVVPAIGTAALPLGAMGASLDAVGLPGGAPLIWLAAGFTRFGLWVSTTCEGVLSASLVWGRPSPWGLVGWTILAVWAPRVGTRPGRLDALTLVLAAALLVADPPPAWRPAPVLRLHAIPVGQGDATLAELPNGTTLLVDAGGSGRVTPDTGLRTVLPYLRSLGHARIDVLVATHQDADHIAGLVELVEPLRPREIWTGGLDASRPLVKSLLEAATRAGARVRRLDTEAHRVEAGRTVIEVLPTHHGFEGNDASLMLRLCIGETCALLSGDAESEREAFVVSTGVPLAAAYLKVPHHGSLTSSTAAFVDAVRPRVAVFHVGYENRFGFPRQATVETYRRRGVVMRRTDGGAAVVWALDEQGLREEQALGRRGW
jgi:competence protein ComEC